VTPNAALQLLQSASNFCLQAGLQVTAANDDNGTLVLSIPNAHCIQIDGGRHTAFRAGSISIKKEVS